MKIVAVIIFEVALVYGLAMGSELTARQREADERVHIAELALMNAGEARNRAVAANCGVAEASRKDREAAVAAAKAQATAARIARMNWVYRGLSSWCRVQE